MKLSHLYNIIHNAFNLVRTTPHQLIEEWKIKWCHLVNGRFSKVYTCCHLVNIRFKKVHMCCHLVNGRFRKVHTCHRSGEWQIHEHSHNKFVLLLSILMDPVDHPRSLTQKGNTCIEYGGCLNMLWYAAKRFTTFYSV